MQASGARDTQIGGSERIDCSVLVPVLNEKRHIGASVYAMLEQRFPGTVEFVLVDGGSTDGTRSVLSDLAHRDPRLRVLDNPRGTTPSGLNIALAHARGRWVARMDGHTEYPCDYLALGVERLRRGDTRWVSGPQVATGDGPVSRAVALALRTPLGRGGSRKWGNVGRRGTEEYELDSGVFAGVWERDNAARVRGLGRRLAPKPGLGDGGTLPGSWGAVDLPPGDGRQVHAAQLDQVVVAPVPAVRRLPGEDRAASSAHDAPFASDRPVAGADPRRRDRRTRSAETRRPGGLGAYAVALVGAGARAAFDESVPRATRGQPPATAWMWRWFPSCSR